MTKAEARLELARALSGARRALAPASRTEVIAALTGMSELFQCGVPSDTGLLLYLAAVKDISGPALRRGVGVLSRTHRYPRLPLPAELLEACEGGTSILRVYLTRCERAEVNLEALPG